MYYILYIFAIIFIVVSIMVSILDVKKRKLVGFKKIITVCVYLYFGIMMALFCILISINSMIGLLIFIHLVLIVLLFNLKDKKNILTLVALIIICISSIILIINNLIKVNLYNDYIIYLIFICVYFIPALAYIDRRKYIVNKIKTCTKEIDATIIKVTKSYEYSSSTFHSPVPIYIPTFEFYLDDKKHTFKDTNHIYSRRKFIVGSKVKLFINPNGVKFNYPDGSDDIFFPISEHDRSLTFVVYFWYILSIILFLIIIFG